MSADKSPEVKWWEAKQGMTPFLKKQQLEKKANKHAARKQAQAEKDAEEQKLNPGKNPAKKTQHKKPEFTIQKKERNLKSENSIFNPERVPEDAKLLLENYNALLASNMRLNSKQRALLPEQIRRLSHSLTDERGSRRLGYMNSPESLTAYIHYFLRWNLVRLVKLFSNLPDDFLSLEDGSVCLDIGSGPLTAVTSLFLARPELRTKKLTFYCLDISQSALAAGEDIFLSTAAALKCEPWKIVRVKGEFGTEIKEKASLVFSANVFNEAVDDFKMPPDYLAKKFTQKMLSYTKEDARIILIEPGTPKASRFVSLMRDALLRKDFVPVSPCTHCAECPMDGKRNGKWCNFAFSTEDAPYELKLLSKKAELPKERAVLSFVAVKKSADRSEEDTDCSEDSEISFRIASDEIRLPGNRHGYYACSGRGLLLVETKEKLFSGEAFTVPQKKLTGTTDAKSGALIVRL